MGSSRKRQQESETRRGRILEAASTCFGRHGFAGATVPMIAEEAGVSNGLLYQFFRNKEHLFEVVVRAVLRDWVRAMVRDDTPNPSASERLEGMFRRSVEFCRTHPLLPALLTKEQTLQLQRISSVSTDRVAAHRALVASIIQDGIKAGEFRSDLDVASAADVICQLQVDYSARAYRRDPLYPSDPVLITTALGLIHAGLAQSRT